MNDLCPICHEEKGKMFVTGGRDFFVFDGKSDPFDVLYCERCKVGYTIPYLSDEGLSKYYPEDYEAYTPKKAFMGYLQTLKYGSDMRIIKKRVSEGTLFEIGAGRGEFLSEAKKSGFSVEGIEPGKAGRIYAKEQFDISLVDVWASDIVYEKKYDVIVMRHVIEHLNEPAPVLEKIFTDGLKSGGLLFLKLPRLDSWETRLFGRFCDAFDFPRHRVHFTKQGIMNILERIGYKNIEVISEVVPTSIMRGIQYYGRHGSSGFLNTMARAFSTLPHAVRFLLCQSVGLLMLPFGTDRMIIVARKSKD